MGNYEIQQIFRIGCCDCGEQHEEESWRGARDWLIQHRKTCSLYKNSGRSRVRTGKIVACPICGEPRYLALRYIRQSERGNAQHPELIGIHRVCRMKVIKPAKKHITPPQDNEG